MNRNMLAVFPALVLLLGGCAQFSGKEEAAAVDPCAEDISRLERRITVLDAELRKSQQSNIALREENAELSKTIEMLKVLDQTVEEKRKNYSSQ